MKCVVVELSTVPTFTLENPDSQKENPFRI
jgi:hypothetical protein